jgi:hypothetical protein
LVHSDQGKEGLLVQHHQYQVFREYLVGLVEVKQVVVESLL